MKKWLFLLLLPALAFAQQSAPAKTEPALVFAEIQADKIILHPEQTEIPANAISIPDGPFAQWLGLVALRSIQMPVALVFRPEGVALQPPLARAFEKRSVPFFTEPWEAGRPIDPEIVRHSIELAAITLPPIPPTENSTGLQRLRIGSTSILIATPREIPPQKEPVYWECRHGQLFPISLEEMKTACDAKTEELRKLSGNDDNEFLKQAAKSTVEWNGQSIDFTYALMGKYVLTPVPEAQGVPLGSQVDSLDPDMHLLHLFVRPASLDVFRQIRALAWERKIEVDVQLLDEKEYIQIGRSRSDDGYDM